MAVWLLVLLAFSGPALAGGAPRAGTAARPSGGTVVTGVAPVALGPVSLSPALAPAALSPTPTFAPTPTLAPTPTVAPAVVLSAPAPALHAAPLAALSAADAPASSIAQDAAAEAAPLPGTLGIAQAAASPKSPGFEVIFDGEKPRKPFFSWPTFARAPRIPAATLTRGGPAYTPERYVQPPVLARRIELFERVALTGAATAVGAFSFSSGVVFLAVAAPFLALMLRNSRDALSRERVSIENGVDRSAVRFQARAQRLLDEMRDAAGMRSVVTVRITAAMSNNAFYSSVFPNQIFLGRGLETFDDAALRAIMAHELGHRAMGDYSHGLFTALGALETITYSAVVALLISAVIAHLGVPASVLPFLGAPALPSVTALLIGIIATTTATFAVYAVRRLWEFRADHYGAWLTHPRDMAHALRQIYDRRAAADRPQFTASHPDMRLRFVELRGREPVAAAKWRMPAGVKDALAKAALVAPSMAALSWYVWATAAPMLGFTTFAATFLPLPLLSAHFALIGAFWTARYYAYPRLSARGQAAFRAFFEGVAVAYPLAALTGLGLWTASLFGVVPALLSGSFLPWPALLSALSPIAGVFMAGLLSVIGLIALAEVVHHFVWRAPLKGGRGGAWGNLGQQLLRMRR